MGRGERVVSLKNEGHMSLENVWIELALRDAVVGEQRAGELELASEAEV